MAQRRPGAEAVPTRRRIVGLASSEEPAASTSRPGVRVGLGPIDLTVPQDLYLVVEIGVLLFQLMLVDAAYSGDWSRIGVISPEVELALQKVVVFIVLAHSVTALISGQLAASKGLNPVWATLRGLLFGTLEINLLMQRPATEERT